MLLTLHLTIPSQDGIVAHATEMQSLSTRVEGESRQNGTGAI